MTVTNVFGQFTRRELDNYNRMVSSTDFYGVKTYYTYTPAGLISRIERKDGEKLLSSLAVTYNANGQPIRYTDQSGKVKEFERDTFGRVVKELFPDDPERGYLDDGVPYLAGSIIKDEERTKYQQILQQAAKVKLIQVRQAGSDCWSLETTKKELMAVPVNDEFCQLVQRWATAPTWMYLVPCGVDIAGVFISNDVFVLLDEQGNELGNISIGLARDFVCKPEGQSHYDRLRDKILKALGLPN